MRDEMDVATISDRPKSSNRNAPPEKEYLSNSAEQKALIYRVSTGELSPGDAELMASENGIGPLARDPDGWNPMHETWWTLPMSMSWIAFRNADRVKQFCEKYQAERWVWRNESESPFLGRGPKPTAEMVQKAIAAADQAGEFVNVALAFDALKDRAFDGSIACRVRNLETGNHAEMASFEWGNIDGFEDANNLIYLTRLRQNIPIEPLFLERQCHSPLFSCDQLIAAFPPEADEPPKKQAISATVPMAYTQIIANEINRPLTTSRTRGRPPKADWGVIEDLMRAEIKKRGGLPDAENAPGWQRKADIEKFVSDCLTDRNESVAESTIRDRVNRILADFGSEAGK